MVKNIRWPALGLALVAIFALVAPGASRAEKTFVVAGWGGPYEGWLREIGVIPEFEKKYGVKVSWLSMSSFQNYGRLKAQRDNPQIDVALIDDLVQDVAAREGLLEKLDPEAIPNLADVDKGAIMPNKMGVGFGYNITGLYYNHEVFKEKGWAPPTSWGDLMRPELKGRVVMRHITSAYGLYPMLMLARMEGGSEHKIEPGFEAMKKLAPSTLAFPTSGGKTRNYMIDGSAWISATGTGEVMVLRSKGVPVTWLIPEEGTIPILETASPVKNAPNPKLAQAFINALLAPKAQYGIAVKFSWPHVNKKVKVDDKLLSALPLDPRKPMKFIPVDFQTVMKERDKWNEQFDKEVVPLAR